MQKTRRNKWGVRQTVPTRVPEWENKALKPVAEKSCEARGETRSLTGEFIGAAHRVLEHTQTHPPGNQHKKGPICLWVAEEVTENQQRVEQVELFPHAPLPYIQCHNSATWGPLP